MKNIADFMKELKEYRIHLFKCHSEFVLNTYLEKWAKNLFNQKIDTKLNCGCLIIEDRVNTLTRFCILNTLFMTSLKMKIYIYTTEKSYKPMMDLFADLSRFVEIIQLNINNADLNHIDVPIYNFIFKNSLFWKSIPFEKILVFQSDSLLIEPFDFSMFNYDYVGAPFSEEKHLSTCFPSFSSDLSYEKAGRWGTQVFNRGIPDKLSYGNGGLSIRNRDFMVKVCEAEKSLEGENEDIFFSRFINKYSSNIAPLDVARRFSCECDYQRTIGFHASYLYLSPENQSEIYQRHVRYIISMYYQYKSRV